MSGAAMNRSLDKVVIGLFVKIVSIVQSLRFSIPRTLSLRHLQQELDASDRSVFVFREPAP